MIVKLISLNIWQGGNLWDQVIPFLREEDSDILLMQEVYDGKDESFERKYRTFSEVKKSLSLPYAAFAPAFLDTRTIGNIDRGNAIFSKFPLTFNEAIAYDMPYGPYDEEHDNRYEILPMTLQHAMVLINSVSYHLYNLQGIWGTHGGDSQRRLKMSEKIITEVKDKEHVILAGDFNLNPGTETIKNIEKYMHNVFKDELQTTFNMAQKKNPNLAKSVVDMVFVSNDIKVLERSVPQVNISDHLPLVCTLEI